MAYGIADRRFDSTRGRDLASFPHTLATFLLVGWLSPVVELQCNLPALATQMLQDGSVIAHPDGWDLGQGGDLVLGATPSTHRQGA